MPKRAQSLELMYIFRQRILDEVKGGAQRCNTEEQCGVLLFINLFIVMYVWFFARLVQMQLHTDLQIFFSQDLAAHCMDAASSLDCMKYCFTQ